MEQRKMTRINELAKKAKAGPLTEAEAEEQKALRAEYIAEYRASLRSQLENVVIVDEKGNQRPLKHKQ